MLRFDGGEPGIYSVIRPKGHGVRKLRVAVLMGGTSTERAISLSTGRQIMAALDTSRYIPIALDAASLSGSPPAALPQEADSVELPGVDMAAELVPLGLAEIAEKGGGRPDVVFIALHGKGGEDGAIQGMLELMGIPYTGSGVLASALAMDKSMTKRLLRSEGIPVPAEILLKAGRVIPVSELDTRIRFSFGYPVIVKPNAEGSTIGCRIVRNETELIPAIDEAFRFDSSVLIEEHIEGIEITAGLLGNDEPEVLPLIEIEAEGGFYDYAAKYAAGGSRHMIPARITELAAERARDYSLRSHQALGCRGMSRVDLIVANEQPYVLEVNTIPGMTPTSLLPDAAREAGISFPDLVDRLIQSALEK